MPQITPYRRFTKPTTTMNDTSHNTISPCLFQRAETPNFFGCLTMLLVSIFRVVTGLRPTCPASGWGNFMQELLLNALLAHETNRAWVPLRPGHHSTHL